MVATTSYAKASLNIFEECRAQDVDFTPMVIEITGTSEQMAAAVLQQLAHAVAARKNGNRKLFDSPLLQELSVTIGVVELCATLRRRTELVFSTRAVLPSFRTTEGWFASPCFLSLSPQKKGQDLPFPFFLCLEWIHLLLFPLMFGAGFLSHRSFAFGAPSDSRKGDFHVWSSHTRLLPP